LAIVFAAVLLFLAMLVVLPGGGGGGGAAASHVLTVINLTGINEIYMSIADICHGARARTRSLETTAQARGRGQDRDRRSEVAGHVPDAFIAVQISILPTYVNWYV